MASCYVHEVCDSTCYVNGPEVPEARDVCINDCMRDALCQHTYQPPKPRYVVKVYHKTGFLLHGYSSREAALAVRDRNNAFDQKHGFSALYKATEAYAVLSNGRRVKIG